MNRSEAVSLCGAKTRSGDPCKRPAGAGTDHVGHGHCKLHGGSTPNGKKHGYKAEALGVALTLGAAPDIDPHDALLLCVRSAAAQWRFYETQIAALGVGDILVRPLHERAVTGMAQGESWTDVMDLKDREEANLWIKLRDQARLETARFSKMAIDAGVAERAVQIAEQFGDQLGRLLQGIAADLELTAAQAKQWPAIARKHLTLIAGGAS